MAVSCSFQLSNNVSIALECVLLLCLVFVSPPLLILLATIVETYCLYLNQFLEWSCTLPITETVCVLLRSSRSLYLKYKHICSYY